MADKTYSGSSAAGIPSTKIRAEQIKGEDFGNLAHDLEALRGQIADIIGSPSYKENVSEFDVQLAELNPHLSGSFTGDTLKVKQKMQAVGDAQFDAAIHVAGEADLASAIIKDVTAQHIMFAGTGGAVEGTASLKWDGAHLIAASARVSDLTAGRVTFAGVDGDLMDAAGLTFAAGELTAASATVSDLTDGRVVYAGASGALVDSAEMTFGVGGLTLAKDLTARSGSFSGDLTVTGNLTVQGDTVTVNVSEMLVEDKDIVVAKNGSDAGSLDGAGIKVGNGGGYASMTWSETNSKWSASEQLFAPVLQSSVQSALFLASDSDGDIVAGTAAALATGISGQFAGDANISVSEAAGTITVALDADVEIDSIKLADEAVANVGKALKVGTDGLVTAAAWNEFVEIEANVGLELSNVGFKALIGLAQDIRATASPQFAQVKLDGADNFVDSSVNGLVLHAGLAGDSIVFEYDNGKSISLGTASLIGFTATDIMGALNELKSAASAATKKTTYVVSGAEVNSGTDIAGSLPVNFLSELTAANEMIFVNGQLQQGGGSDYTRAAGALSFAYNLQVGDVVVVKKA